MNLHPHQRWALKYPATAPVTNTPIKVAKKFYLKANRLYARTSNLFIRTNHLPSQAQLNDREVQLQEYFKVERHTRGNGSPIHSNPQQVFTFSPTDEVPINTVIDDFIEFIDPLPVREQDLEFIMIPSVTPPTDNNYQRMVDRGHKRMVQTLLGDPPDVDANTMMRMERRISALGF